MQVTVGECHPKKIQCMLGALQSAFREPAFLPKGGDALNMTLLIHEQEREGKKFIKKIKSQKTYSTEYLNFWLRGFTSLFLQSSEAFGSKRPCSYLFVFVTASKAPTDSIQHTNTKKFLTLHRTAIHHIALRYAHCIKHTLFAFALHCIAM